MTAVAETQTPSLLADYEAFAAALPPASPELGALRRAGRERFAAVGLPTVREEAWRSTNVAPLGRTAFRHLLGRPPAIERERLAPFRLPGCLELVFVGGRFVPELSSTAELPAGVYAGSLAEALERQPGRVLPHLGRHADPDHPFVALNAAHLRDGLFVHVPRGAVVEKTIHASFFPALEGGDPGVAYPRNLIVVEERGELRVVETYGGFGDEVYFTCPVTEIVLGPAAVVDHYKLGEESLGAFHVAFQKATLGRDASFFSHSITWGGALVRNDIQAWLGEPGVDCTLNGLYLARGLQQVDHQMRVDHKAEHCHSYELFKGILEDRSRATFNGRIYVHPGAQKTDAKQSNRNLLLSRDALVHSNPQLEIFADDVRCTHGSTTGHLDDEAVFYLRSRGIGEEAAKSLLTYAFAAEVLQEIRLEEVKKDLEEFLFTRLPKGDVVRQAV